MNKKDKFVYYNNYKQILSKKINTEYNYIKQFCEIYFKFTNMVDFKEVSFGNIQYKNLLYIYINCICLIEECISNIILKNISVLMVLERTLMESFYIFKFLKNSDDYTNEVFYEYNQIRYINIIRKECKNNFEIKYKIDFKVNVGDQWIKIVNKHNKYKGNGFKSIIEQVNLSNQSIEWLYKFMCNFSHISLSGIDFKMGYISEKSKYENIFIDSTSFLLKIFKELLKEEEFFLDTEENKDLIKNINNYIESI